MFILVTGPIVRLANSMILAVDVHYKNDSACVAGVLFEHWTSRSTAGEYKSHVKKVEQYMPGQFYKRELPCILQLLAEHTLHPDVIVIDGYVFLDGHTKPGLGKHLYESLDRRVPVVGVAKEAFRGIGTEFAVFRGRSTKPLYVTAAGCSASDARTHIKAMFGKHRMPQQIKRADQVCRDIQGYETTATLHP